MNLNKTHNILGVDYGSVRVGLATLNLDTKFAAPYKTITNDDNLFPTIATIIKDENIAKVIVGYPRNLNGDKTAQTLEVEKFIENLKSGATIEVQLQDEALTSVKAKELLNSQKKQYNKEEIDALAAALILEDYITELKGDEV